MVSLTQITTAQKLRQVIDARGLPLGRTDTGKAWCIKALHPADPLCDLTGIPDLSSHQTLVQNYAQSYTLLNPLPANPGNWDADLFIFPHPYLLGAVKTTDAAGTVAWSPILNNQITGVTVEDKCITLQGMCQRYRLAYLGVTGYLNCSATSNNGLLACAQYMQTPVMETAYITDKLSVAPVAQSVSYNMRSRLLEGWNDEARSFEQLQNMPNSYFGSARDGVYAPFRLSEVCQDWVNASDTILHDNYPSTLKDAELQHYVDDVSTIDGPYGLEGWQRDSNARAMSGWMLHRRADEGVIQISVRQIASDASFALYFRTGYEMQVMPGTPLVSFLKTSPVYDEVALTTYYLISREMKDAYPADFNDLGKLLEVIASAIPVVRNVVGPTKALFDVLKPHVKEAVASIRARKAARLAPGNSSNSGLSSTQPVSSNVSAATLSRTEKRLA